MSKKLKEVEKDIIKYRFKLAGRQSAMAEEILEDEDFIDYGKGHRELLMGTPESLLAYIEYLEKQRQFELERKARKFYNQSWFHILITAVVSIITTVVAAWIINIIVK